MAVLLLPLIDVGLRVWRFRHVYRALLTLSPRPSTDAPLSDVEIVQLVQMVNAPANRGLVRATCLRRSLAVWWLLRLRHMESDLKIGVRRRNGCFEAHAWVERNDVALNDHANIGQEFSVLALDEALGIVRWI